MPYVLANNALCIEIDDRDDVEGSAAADERTDRCRIDGWVPIILSVEESHFRRPVSDEVSHDRFLFNFGSDTDSTKM